MNDSATQHPASSTTKPSSSSTVLFSCIITVLALLIAAVVYLAFFKKSKSGDNGTPISFFSATLSPANRAYTRVQALSPYAPSFSMSIVFDTVQCDPLNAYSVNSGIYTLPKTGLYTVNYYIVAHMALNTTTPVTLAVSVQNNTTGASLFGSSIILGTPGIDCSVPGIMNLQLNRGDTLVVNAQISGGTLSIMTGSYFQVTYIGEGPSPSCKFGTAQTPSSSSPATAQTPSSSSPATAK